jgi:hypothetical protein
MNDALENLESMVRTAQWFTRLGKFDKRPGMVAIKNLQAWADENVDASTRDIADDMQWLPTTLDAEDPLHHGRLLEELEEQAKIEQATRVALQVHKVALASLRTAPRHPLLVVGQHDFTKAARGAALFAVRQATLECVADVRPALWESIISVYHDGFWPCGLLGKNVVVL